MFTKYTHMKLNSKFWKGLIITLVGVVIAAFNTTPVIWTVVIVTLFGTALVYFGKNAWYSSESPNKEFDWKDVGSAILIAAGTALVTTVAQIAGSGHIDWPLFWQTISGAVISYISVTFFEGQKKPV